MKVRRLLKIGQLSALLTLTVLSGCSTPAELSGSRADQGLGISDVNFNVTKKVLDNGLTVLIIEKHDLPIFAYYTFYKVGSKFESNGITGSSHFLEHMMFKGAKKYGPGEFENLIEGNGGRNNAYTTYDHTVYYESLPSEHIGKVIDIEADRMMNLSLEEKSFENERQVVLEERKMRYENNDQGKAFYFLQEAMFKGTPYETSVIGTIKDLKSVTRDQVHDYFKKFYAPNNAIIVIVGNVNSVQVIDAIKTRYSSIKSNDSIEDYKKKMITSRGGFDFKNKLPQEININGTILTPTFLQAYRGEKNGTRENFVLDILGSMIGGGESSYLNQNLVLGKRSVLSSVFTWNYSLEDSGLFVVGGTLLPKVSLAKARAELNKQLKKSCDESVTERNLMKVKNQYLTSFFSGLESSSTLAELLGKGEAYFQDYNYYKKEFEYYESITVEDLKKTCHDLLKAQNAVFVNVWNKHPKRRKI